MGKTNWNKVSALSAVAGLFVAAVAAAVQLLPQLPTASPTQSPYIPREIFPARPSTSPLNAPRTDPPKNTISRVISTRQVGVAPPSPPDSDAPNKPHDTPSPELSAASAQNKVCDVATISRCKEDVRINSQRAATSCQAYLDCSPDDPGALSYLGQANRALGRLASARTAFERQLEIGQNKNDEDVTAGAYHNIALVFLEQNATDQAELAFKKSLEINVRKSNFLGQGANYKGLGDVHFQRGDLTASEDYFRRAISIEESIDDKVALGDAYVGLGYVRIRKGDRDSGCSYLHRAREMFADANYPLRVEKVENHLTETRCK